MSKMKTKTIKEELIEDSAEAQEQQLATDLELISLIRENADILQRHPEWRYSRCHMKRVKPSL